MIGTAEDIALIKELLRIDDESDATDRIIGLYMGAAERWLTNAGVKVSYADEQIVEAVSMYVGVRYDEPEGIGVTDRAAMTLAAAAEQIRLSQIVQTETVGDGA